MIKPLMCKRLREMLKDEKIAPNDYSKLKKLLPIKERSKITKIQKQERNHYKTLIGIKKRLKNNK
jgi:rubrerythrin